MVKFVAKFPEIKLDRELAVLSPGRLSFTRHQFEATPVATDRFDDRPQGFDLGELGSGKENTGEKQATSLLIW